MELNQSEKKCYGIKQFRFNNYNAQFLDLVTKLKKAKNINIFFNAIINLHLKKNQWQLQQQ